MDEADTQHNRNKYKYKREALVKLDINEADAQRRFKKVQQQAQQEAQQYVGSVVSYAEQAHINKLREGSNKTYQAEKRATQEHLNRLKKENTNREKAEKRANKNRNIRT